MLTVHRAPGLEGLLDPLLALLAEPLDDPLAPEVVAVPTRGVERWLVARLGQRLGASPGWSDGVVANVRFPFPSRLVAEALGAGADPDDDPWSIDRLQWAVLAELAEGEGDPRLGPAALHREGRLPRARRLADLYDHYAVHRPSLLREWAGEAGEGAGLLSRSHEWQLHLWRRLRARLGPGPAERRTAALAALRSGEAEPALPARLALFGVTALPPAHLEVLEALGERRDVHLLVTEPSPALAEAVRSAGPRAPVRRADDRTGSLALHPLLVTWGRSAREAALLLPSGRDAPTQWREEPVTLLHRLQAAVRANQAPPAKADRPVLDPVDRSVQVHRCHGRARQVEVLRDALLHCFAEDPTLSPADVEVLCPDLDAFGHLIEPTFAGGSGVPPIPVRVATRRSATASPLVGALDEICRLLTDRFTASALLDLAGAVPVRRRLGLGDDDLAAIADWAERGALRWGLDGPDRAVADLPSDLAAGTVRALVERLAAGVVAPSGERRLVLGLAPLDVTGDGVRVAGAVADLAARLDAAARLLREPAERPAPAWGAALAEVAELLLDAGPEEGWQQRELDRALARLRGAGVGDEPSDVPVRLAEARAILAEQRRRPARPEPESGAVTVAELLPLRSVPARVVALLGMDEELLSPPGVDGDDLLAADPRIGDPDPAAEARQLVLDAVLAAGDRLLLVATGRDVRTNQPVPAAVPVDELLDALDDTAVAAGGGKVSDWIVVEHPRQAFATANLVGGGLGGLDGPWSFDESALAGARARARRRHGPAPFLAAPLPPLPADWERVELATLADFCQQPVKHFLAQRLDLRVPAKEEQWSDALALKLDALQSWQLADELLEVHRRGEDPVAWVEVVRADGRLPLGALGEASLDVLHERVHALLAAARSQGLPLHEGASEEIEILLPTGQRLAGSVGGVHGGDTVGFVSASGLNGKTAVRARLPLLVLNAARPDVEWRSVAVLWVKPHAVTVCLRMTGPPSEREARALHALGRLGELFVEGRCEPLPIFPRTSYELLTNRYEAERQWEAFERDDPSNLLAFGRVDLPALLSGGAAGLRRGHDARSLAARLWAPLMEGFEAVE